MALQSSGAITLAQIQTEFGGSNPISMSEYYRLGSYVTSNNTNIPTSGTISMNQFYSGDLLTSGSQTFSSGNSNFTIPSHNQMTIVVHGGGGGGQGGRGWYHEKGGGGGGSGDSGHRGGTRTLTNTTTYVGNVGSTFAIVVGAGGNGSSGVTSFGGTNAQPGSNGNDSTISFNSSVFMTGGKGHGGDVGGVGGASSGSGSGSVAGGLGGAGGNGGQGPPPTASSGAAGGSGSVIITWS